MKQLNSFLPNSKIINCHLKSNWKSLLIGGIVWLLFVNVWLFLFATQLSPKHVISIVFPGNEFSYSVLGVLNQITMYSVVVFSIISSVMVHHVIGREIRKGEITIWMASPISRNKIMISKIVFIWCVNLIIIAPSLIPILIYGGIAVDAGQNFGDLIAQLLTMVLFILMISTLFASIALACSNMGRVTGMIHAEIILYMIVFTAFGFLGQEWSRYFQYINLKSLLVWVYNSDPYNHVQLYRENLGWIIGSMFINIALISGLTYLPSFIFKRKDLMG
ncbi:hypothetical protein ELUMI_v1c03740 [Williamsoniiplasma luminosum]|uniref:ABC transporter permease n=1 Tax=Williamsoniiplasma luminosum TaxID=214888 RepID=A0A2K8NTI3_9MOLU|nr:ABC transporter permease subunit [Williamsoniiplasma luminosum]ATZ17099.1 hypothetical protein ELUMI_v1c03740 [Williamsoniiplasma luminosum]